MLIGVVRRTRLISLLAASVWTATPFAQPAAQRAAMPLASGTSAIRGTLNDAVTKEPIAGCTVRAAASGRVGGTVTSADGTYEFAGIAEGDYGIMASCPHHLFACYQPDPNGPLCVDVVLFRDQQRSNIDLKLVPAATVRGRVVDSRGKPASKAPIRLGGPFVGNTVARAVTTVTRDDGTFEVPQVSAGSWHIQVELPPADGGYSSVIVYYPGVLSPYEAGFIDVATGTTKENVVITVPPVLENTLTVRVPPPDANTTEMTVSIIRAVPLMTRRLDVDANGEAIVKGLASGRYIVLGTVQSGGQRWADFQPVDFLDQSMDVALQPQPAGTIRGRIVTDRGALPSLSESTIGAAWVDGDVTLNPLAPDETPIASDGTFEIGGVFGRRVLQLVRFDALWQIHAVMHGKTDVTTSGIDVVPGATSDVTIVVRPK
ncbi:MAG TPA: carboxypeptidase regulatory-like domain-containing protein [Vicinamibacterales bacterium]|nr:carboxypeptidase regulatory-like domain-containing protein [Vicinamibacterales bacterium]